MRSESRQQFLGPVPENQPCKAAERREHRALRQQLPDHTIAARSQRKSNRDLALAPNGPHQQQVRQIGAGDQQNEPHRAQENKERRAHAARNIVRQQSGAGFQVLAHVRVSQGETLRNGVQFGAGGGEGSARLQPSEHIDAMIAVLREQVRRIRRGDVKHQRDGHVELAWATKAGWQDSDDGVSLVIERDGTAQEMRIAAKARTPQLVAHDDDALCAWAVLLGQKIAPKRGRNAESGEIVRGHLLARETIGWSALGYVHAGDGEAGQRHEGIFLGAIIHQIRRRDCPSAHFAAPKGLPAGVRAVRPLADLFLPQGNQATGLRIGQRLKHHCVDDAEDRAIDPDSKRERENRHYCESRRFQQQANGIAEIIHGLGLCGDTASLYKTECIAKALRGQTAQPG